MSAADYVHFGWGSTGALFAHFPIPAIDGVLTVARGTGNRWHPVAVEIPGAGRQSLNPFGPAISPELTIGLTALADEWVARNKEAQAA